jgi:uroporphyrinogen decarboxylase
MLQTYRALPEAAKEQTAVCVGLTGAFSQLGFLLGLEKLLVAMIDQPDTVHRALACRQKAALRQADEICRAGARFIWIGEGMATGSLISPAMYREFVLPYEQALVQHIRRRGALSLLHICGNTSMMLVEIAQTGADGCDIDAPTDWAAAWEILGSRMCLKGNINPLLFLPEHIAGLPPACEDARRVAAGRPGFILSTGCLVPPGAVPEAFNVMARACGRNA